MDTIYGFPSMEKPFFLIPLFNNEYLETAAVPEIMIPPLHEIFTYPTMSKFPIEF